MQDSTGPRSFQSRSLDVMRQPRITLLILAGWSVLAAMTQIFVNSGLFLDTHDRELDGALGSFALSLNAVPLAVLYFFCARDSDRYIHVVWLALVQGIMVFANLYHLIIGTFSAESFSFLWRVRLRWLCWPSCSCLPRSKARCREPAT